MSTKIENFIRNNKGSFDTDIPVEDLWSKMELELNRKTKKRSGRMLWLSIAASFIAVLSIAYFYSKKDTSVNALADVSPANAKKEVRFTSMIERKTDSLQIYADENPELYQKFSADLAKIQVDYDALKQELVRSPNQEFIIRAMEKNLELQLQVVSQQLQIVNKVRQVNKDNQL